MEDNTFGSMSFNHGWTKKEKISLWGNNYNLDIRTSSYQNQLPTEKQKAAYQDFKKRLLEIDSLSAVKVCQYLLSESIEDFPTNLDELMEIFQRHVIPQEILFFQDGTYAIVCDTDWSDDGIAILIDCDKIIADVSYILEFKK